MRRFVLTRIGYSAVSLVLLSLTIFVVVRATGAVHLMSASYGGWPRSVPARWPRPERISEPTAARGSGQPSVR